MSKLIFRQGASIRFVLQQMYQKIVKDFKL